MEYFFDADKPHWTGWCRMYNMDMWYLFFKHTLMSERVKDDFLPSPLYHASVGGFYDLVEHLVGKHPEHINSKGRMGTPLAAALSGGYLQVADLLYRNGADVDYRGNRDTTLLREASEGGHLDALQWLTNHGADVNA
jgi:ankyrin repeat protein